MATAEPHFVQRWSTLPKGSTIDFYRNSHQGIFLNQKGVEVLEASDTELNGQLASGGPVTYAREDGEIVRT